VQKSPKAQIGEGGTPTAKLGYSMGEGFSKKKVEKNGGKKKRKEGTEEKGDKGFIRQKGGVGRRTEKLQGQESEKKSEKKTDFIIGGDEGRKNSAKKMRKRVDGGGLIGQAEPTGKKKNVICEGRGGKGGGDWKSDQKGYDPFVP